MADDPTYDEHEEPAEFEPTDIEPTDEEAPRMGNRPADGALRVSAESELNKSWQGGEGAADFLGLDQDLRAPIEHPQVFENEAPAHEEPVAVPEATVELEEPQEAEAHSMALDAEDTQQSLAQEGDESWLLDEDASAEEPRDVLQPAPRGRGRLVGAALALLLACGAGWYYGLGPGAGTLFDTQVAVTDPTTSHPAPTTNTNPEPAPVTETNEVTPEPVIEVVTPEPEVIDPEPSTGDPAAEALVNEFSELIAEVEGGQSSDPAENVANAEPTTDEPTDRVERVVQISPSDMIALPEVKSHLRLATPEEMNSLMWSETEIPHDKFAGTSRLLTPNVGRVRVVISGDEIFEGTLYAVGQGQVWIDSKIGRVALEASSVRDVQQIGGTDRTPELGGFGSERLAGLPRVRVRSAGGNFYGKVVAREGDLVTLIPDTGGRIRLESSEIEIVGEMRTSLIREDGQ